MSARIKIREFKCRHHGCTHPLSLCEDPAASCPNGLWQPITDSKPVHAVRIPRAPRAEAGPKTTTPHAPGAGTVLKGMLSGLGIVATESCSCNAMAETMDRQGVAWCETHIAEIVAVMTEEASKRGWMKLVPFKALGARKLVERAIAATRNHHQADRL